MTNVLQEAGQIVQGVRYDEHGHPGPNLERAALMWSAILKAEVTAEEVALCMIAYKLVRASSGTRPHKDNLIDIAGYARTIEMLWERNAHESETSTGAEAGTTRDWR